VWLLDPEVWALLFATALASLALVLLLEMLPGRPSIFLIALIIAVATVVSFMIWGARRPLPSSVRPFAGLTAGNHLVTFEGRQRRSYGLWRDADHSPAESLQWPALRRSSSSLLFTRASLSSWVLAPGSS
jgi:hypothetical protein